MAVLLTISVIVGISFLFVLFSLQPAAGSGERMEEPKWSGDEEAYLISNLRELSWIRNDLDNNYVLVDNIDASGTKQWNDGKGFEPIGDWEGPFTGVFDGQGHTISDLFIDRPDADYVGLFGAAGEGAIKNVGVINTEATGNWNVGVLVGYNYSDVSDSYATGNITGDAWTGGLVGSNNGSVSSSYVMGEVTGEFNIGGLVGMNKDDGSVNNSYSTSIVSGKDFVGGLVGSNFGGVSDIFWDVSVSGQEDSAGGVGKTTKNMTVKETFTEADWDFDKTWSIEENETYPFLQWQEPDTYPDAPEEPVEGTLLWTWIGVGLVIATTIAIFGIRHWQKREEDSEEGKVVKNRPLGIAILGVLDIVIGILVCSLGILALAGAAFSSGLARGATLITGLLFLALGMFAITVGGGFWTGKNWAWITGLILYIIGLSAGVVTVLTGDVMGIVGVIVEGVIIYYLFKPNVKKWFGRA
ncbi:hypothetical protein AKJ61_01605 [candidate division MSBL1 archaeon SCGC-AAA259B11]|uniref:GLUG domain-containing protein n=1 Tax=candidate division MSBL1 archaeon SCGC-AAA259B11 TaxID=1698260 RepID=A0A133U727_9EURY|nr:hypothetical protein AKJ61_01605 [candidate division MSBL1 archaeon SCGC-AAA259B11]